MDHGRLHNLFPSMSRAYSAGKDTTHVSAATAASSPNPQTISAKLLFKKRRKKLYRRMTTMSTDTPKVSAFFILLIKCPNVLETNDK